MIHLRESNKSGHNPGTSKEYGEYLSQETLLHHFFISSLFHNITTQALIITHIGTLL